MIPSAYADTFARDHLPPAEQWPDLIFDLPDYRYPDRLNCVTELLDQWVAKGGHDRPCLITDTETVTYGALAERVNRIANVLVKDLGLKSGQRVLLRSANNPQFVAAYLAVMKAGGIAVATMPLLRATELAYPLNKARISFSLCDHRLAEEMEKVKALAPALQRIVYFNSPDDDGLEALMRKASPDFEAFDTAGDDVCLIGFTSGTTGEPKGTMHFHRDVLLIADGYGKHVLRADENDRFIGSPPLAFTFGLGGLVVFPMRIGACSILLEKATPDDLIAAIDRHQATVSFTAPTAYRAMLGKRQPGSLISLRKCVSAGETLPKAVFDAWQDATGIKLMDGIGATEMLHIFIGAPEEKIRAGSTGLPVPGYLAKIVDKAGQRSAARNGRAPRRKGPDRLPLSR